MENHPIPQDVTGFQFKLIGNMTVKQFAYLATGIVMGWVFLQMPVSIFIKLPLGIFSAIFGIGLTFFPISGRPMDAMIGNFIKALLKPTQFVYEKTGGQLYFTHTGVNAVKKQYASSGIIPFQQKDKLKAYLESQAMQKNKIDEKENNFLMSVSTLTNNAPLIPSINPALNIPKPIIDMPLAKPTSPPIVQTAQKTLNPLPKSFNKNIGLPNVPDSPNLITGVTRDPRGNPLSNILVEIKDKEGNPVRAFKTNELGRFASATPLINGNYTIEFEDPKGQNKFEKGIVNVTGQIIQPLVTISIDTREELRMSLFSPDASGLTN